MENRVLYSASEWGGGQASQTPYKEKNRGGRGVRRKRGEEVGDGEGETLQSQREREREREREEGEGNREGETYLFDFRMSGLISFLKLLKFCLPCLHLTHVHTMKHYSQLLRLLTLCL